MATTNLTTAAPTTPEITFSKVVVHIARSIFRALTHPLRGQVWMVLVLIAFGFQWGARYVSQTADAARTQTPVTQPASVVVPAAVTPGK